MAATKKTMNELASERCAELWREFFKTEEGKKVLERARQGKEFLRRLAKEMSQ